MNEETTTEASSVTSSTEGSTKESSISEITTTVKATKIAKKSKKKHKNKKSEAINQASTIPVATTSSASNTNVTDVVTTNKKTTTTTSKATTTKTTKATTTTTTKQAPYCTLTIECKTILDNMDKLKSGHSDYVPSDGYILKEYKCPYSNGDTAYDILKRGCDNNGIKLTAENTSFGIYVSGINNLDQFDCGKQSGWLYSVNGTQPNIGCGNYTVSSNDTVIFSYTCTYK